MMVQFVPIAPAGVKAVAMAGLMTSPPPATISPRLSQVIASLPGLPMTIWMPPKKSVSPFDFFAAPAEEIGFAGVTAEIADARELPIEPDHEHAEGVGDLV